MSVKLELTFNSFDEAVVALGKLALPLQAQPTAAAAAVVEKGPRKPRADKGQERGPQQNPAGAKQEANAGAAVAPAANPGGATAVQPAAAPAAASTNAAAPEKAPAEGDKPQPSGVTPAPAAAAPTPEAVQAAVEKLFNAKGFDDCAAVLSRFGVKRGKDLKDEHRAEFIGRVEDIAAGKYAATDTWPQ